MQLEDELVVFPDLGVVEVGGIACLESGWLEQVACSAETRVHESLVAIEVSPSAIHAALLMAGFEPGSPGRWEYDEPNNQMIAHPPSGDVVAIDVQWRDDSGKLQRQPIQMWMRQADPEEQQVKAMWAFAGSRIVPDPRSEKGSEFYLADRTGSIIGLVTFGDELLAFRQVISDLADVREATGEPTMLVNEQAVPPVGTPVTIILHRPDEPEVTAPER